MMCSFILSTTLMIMASNQAFALVAQQPRSRDQRSLFVTKNFHAAGDANDPLPMDFGATNGDIHRRKLLECVLVGTAAALVVAPAPARAFLSEEDKEFFKSESDKRSKEEREHYDNKFNMLKSDSDNKFNMLKSDSDNKFNMLKSDSDINSIC